MKVLIWFGCIFVATILNTLLGYVTGVKLGYLVFYLGVYFAARKLCQKWDEHKEAKKQQKEFAQIAQAHANESNVSVEAGVRVYNSINHSAASGWKCVCGRVHAAYEMSCVCGKSKLDTIEQSKSIEATTQPPVTSFQKNDKIRFCRKCGEKLIDESRFCRKCGTQVVEIMASPE